MTHSDPIADMLTRIRNAVAVYHSHVDIPGSEMKRAICEILKKEGFVQDYQWIDDNKQGLIRVYLKYGPNREKVISGLKRISKPGLRSYVGKTEVPRVLGGLGIAVLSTSQGMMTDKEARIRGIGGEVVCHIW